MKKSHTVIWSFTWDDINPFSLLFTKSHGKVLFSEWSVSSAHYPWDVGLALAS